MPPPNAQKDLHPCKFIWRLSDCLRLAIFSMTLILGFLLFGKIANPWLDQFGFAILSLRTDGRIDQHMLTRSVGKCSDREFFQFNFLVTPLSFGNLHDEKRLRSLGVPALYGAV